MPRPRAVIFDLGGQMFNTEELYVEVGSQLLCRRGPVFTQELLDRMMGRPSRVALQITIDTHALSATVEELVMETDELFPEILRTRLAPVTGLVELLDALERHDIQLIGACDAAPGRLESCAWRSAQLFRRGVGDSCVCNSGCGRY